MYCDGATPDSYGNFVMPDAAVTCTFTNAAMQTVTLQKEWVNGTQGDTAALSINGGDPVASTSNGAKGSWIDADNVDVMVVSVGSVATVTEEVAASNKGTYEKPVLKCTGDVVLGGGSFTVPQSAVTCTFTNKAVSVTAVIPITPVKPAAVIGLARTGSDIAWPLAVGGMLAAIGALIALIAWVRRRTDGQIE